MNRLRLGELDAFIERMGYDLISGEITVDEFIVKIREFVEELVREEQG